MAHSSLTLSLSWGHLCMFCFWCGWTVGSVCKTPDTIRLSHATAFPARFAVVPGDEDISSSLSIFPCGEPVIQKSLQGDRRQVVGAEHRKGCDPSVGQKNLNRSDFLFGLGLIGITAKHFFVFLQCTWLIWTDAPPVLLTIFNTHLSSASPVSPLPHLLC